MRRLAWCSNQIRFAMTGVLVTGVLVAPPTVLPQMQSKIPSAAQLLKDANYYHGIDDISDRAADRYKQLLAQYPTSAQAEQAQFYLGTYYQKKFFILEDRNKIQDWTSFNQAEAALNAYIQKYSLKGTRAYLADAYHTLAIIALRRGDISRAKQLLIRMKTEAAKDRTVYLYKIVWSSRSDDVIKSTCDSTRLATDTTDVIANSPTFAQMINKLRDKCRQNCKAGG